MDTKHTKGPWYASRLSEGVWIIKNEAFDSYIALTHNREGVHADANAHLIAAAPDLLEALRWIVDSGDQIEGRPACHAMRAKAREAIRKAEGE